MSAQGSGLPPELKNALQGLHRARAERPNDSAGPLSLASWHEDMARVFDKLAQHLLYESDREQATAAATKAREQAARLRSTATDEASGGGL